VDRYFGDIKRLPKVGKTRHLTTLSAKINKELLTSVKIMRTPPTLSANNTEQLRKLHWLILQQSDYTSKLTFPRREPSYSQNQALTRLNPALLRSTYSNKPTLAFSLWV